MTADSLRKLAASLTLILVATAFSRLAFAWREMTKVSPPLLAAVAFQTEAGSIARSLAQGKGFSSPYERETGPTAILPPIYPLLVAGVFRLFGIASVLSFRVLFSLNVLFATLTCIPVFFLGRRLGGGAGPIAAWLWALFPNGIILPFEWIWDTSLSALLLAALLWFTVRLGESPTARKWAAFGLLLGLALMTNPSIGAAFPVLLCWAWRRKEPAGWRGPVLALAVAVACCIPWTVRNYLVFDRLIPLRSGFGFELYIGNNENYAGSRATWPPKISFEREQLRYIRMGEVPFMEEERSKAVAFMRTHPLVALRLFGKRILDFWVGTAAPIESLEAEESWPNRFLLICNLLVPLGVLAGLLALVRHGHPLVLPLAAFPVLYPLVYYLTHTSLRYRHVIDPSVFLLVGAFLAGLGQLSRGSSVPAGPSSPGPGRRTP
jgi:4-amino-4-deoxy-L-arabinose transferase-like glycosyltransferase